MISFLRLLTLLIFIQRDVLCFNGKLEVSLQHISKLRLRMSDPTSYYSPLISLIRQGPIPFFIRLTQPTAYEAAVESLMAERSWDRTSAQSSIDSYYRVTTNYIN